MSEVMATWQERSAERNREAAHLLGSASVIIENFVDRSGLLKPRYKRERAEEWLDRFRAHMSICWNCFEAPSVDGKRGLCATCSLDVELREEMASK